jgi:hypothetical protein
VWPRNHRQLFAIERPVEVVDVFGSEIGKLLALGTIQRLLPKVVHAIVTHELDHGFAITTEAHWPESEALKLLKFSLAGSGGHKSQEDALKRLSETQSRENEDRNDWLKDMRKAAQVHAIDHGIGNMLDSTKEGLTEAETELHAEIQEVKQEAEEAHQLRDAAQKAMGTAQGDPKRLAELQAELDDIEKNKIGPLFEKKRPCKSSGRPPSSGIRKWRRSPPGAILASG